MGLLHWLVAIVCCHLAAAGPLDCDFETDLCGYQVLTDKTPGLYDVMEWRQGQAVEKQEYYDLKLLSYGPDVDHTTGQPDGSFMYAIKPINPNTNTTLMSPVGRGPLCYLEFFYHMGSRSLKTMTAYIVKYGEWIKIFSATGYQGYEWNRALIDIEKYTQFGDYQIAIVATEPDSAYWTVGYAVDDIRGMECNLPIKCDFEHGMCDFEVERDTYLFDRMEWEVGQTTINTWFGRINIMRDGPSGDHTLGNKDGHFAYALKPIVSRTNTTMVSPKQTAQLCYLEFYYFMGSEHLNDLDVYVRKDNTQVRVFHKDGYQGNTWQRALIDIEKETAVGSYELAIFVNEPDRNYWSLGYALDDIDGYKCQCTSSPCQNGGSCVNSFKDYNCTCPKFFAGKNCEIDQNPCRQNPCQNAAKCIAHDVGNYSCQCEPGWSGHDCEVNIDECASDPCQNNATCIDGVNKYTCTCVPGYTGTTCDVEVDECFPPPCFNGGTCTDGFNSYTCDCPLGFTGLQCETNIDECASSPCQHGSACFDLVNGYICICLKDYAGRHCEIRESLDCDFEKNICGYSVDTDDTGNNDTAIEWQRGPVSTPGIFGNQRALTMGPPTDHTSGDPDAYIVYAKAAGTENVTTRLTSPLQEGRICYLEFFYHMGSSSLRDLNVYVIQNGTKHLVMTQSGFVDFEWRRAVLDVEDLTLSGRYQVQFEVSEPNSGSSLGVGYAIDDIRGMNCDLDMSCNFETDYCNYYVETDSKYFDRMEWKRGQAVLETIFSSIRLLRNGPDTDHTLGTKDGNFVYALKPVNPGTNTTLVAPRQRRQMCFVRFYYHMGSEYLNDLIVSVRKDDENLEVFRVSGYQGNTWNEALINIENETRDGRYELNILATEPDGEFWTVGYAVDDITVSPCFCDQKPCLNGGTCKNAYFGFTCSCPYLFGGHNCSERRQPCDYKPCQNSGSCKNLPKDDYECTCSPGWTGKNCDVNVDECESFPCKNGATCVDGVNSFTCSCLDGYYGKLCELEVDECISRPCQNGAKCIDGINSFTCDCAGGFFGVLCQFEINECEPAPCQNNATCVDDINFYSCLCPEGYTGKNCELDIDECQSNPCQNGGLCVDRLAGYNCYCRPGFTGLTCRINVNECWSLPCQNGATCQDQVNSYSCACVPGFKGTYCETEINECESSPCRNGGTCVDKLNGFECLCTSTYTGDRCEKSLAACGLDPC